MEKQPNYKLTISNFKVIMSSFKNKIYTMELSRFAKEKKQGIFCGGKRPVRRGGISKQEVNNGY
jgi:hypothetical protein